MYAQSKYIPAQVGLPGSLPAEQVMHSSVCTEYSVETGQRALGKVYGVYRVRLVHGLRTTDYGLTKQRMGLTAHGRVGI